MIDSTVVPSSTLDVRQHLFGLTAVSPPSLSSLNSYIFSNVYSIRFSWFDGVIDRGQGI